MSTPVNPFAGYVQYKLGHIDPAKLEKALKGNKIHLTNENLTGNRVMLIHPNTARLLEKAKKSGKGVKIHFTPHDAIADLAFHHHSGGNLQGGSLWSWLKNKAWPWVKKNVIPKVLDVGVPALATYLGNPELAAPAREAVRQIAGVGFELDSSDDEEEKPKVTKKGKLAKGSQEAKDRMAKIRAMKKSKPEEGGSFRMP